jgi:ABC-2 type transport system ATP-binding protein
MRDGKLLAMDTPLALKASHVPGEVVEMYIEPLLDGLNALKETPGVLSTVLAGDHLRAIVEPGMAGRVADRLRENPRLRVENIVRGEPSLEDVFLSLAKQ